MKKHRSEAMNQHFILVLYIFISFISLNKLYAQNYINQRYDRQHILIPRGIYLVTYQSADGRIRASGKVVVF